MNNLEIGGTGRVSLARRLAEGRTPAGDVLRWASLLAEALRRAHDEGRVHGFLTPAAVWLNGAAVEIAAPPAGPPGVTPYTAPELQSGRLADRRSDVFSFGAILYEMLTGRRAFAGESQAELAGALKSGQPAPTGSPAADRILAGCLVKDPAGRWQQIQKVILELRLLALVARNQQARAAARPVESAASKPVASNPAPADPQPAEPVLPVPAAPPPQSLFPQPEQPQYQALATSPPLDYSAIRREMQQSESRLSARLQLGEKAMAVLNRAVADALTGLRSQISTLTTQMAAMQDRRDSGSLDGEGAAPQAALARMEQTLQAFGTRMEVIEKGIGVLQDRMTRTEQEAGTARQQVGVLQDRILEDFGTFEQSLQKQTAALDSARAAMAQTDDLVGRLVEALEALQATLLQRSEEWTTASVN